MRCAGGEGRTQVDKEGVGGKGGRERKGESGGESQKLGQRHEGRKREEERGTRKKREVKKRLEKLLQPIQKKINNPIKWTKDTTKEDILSGQ